LSLTGLRADGSDKAGFWLPFSLSVRFAVAFTGIVVFWWLANGQDVQRLIPLPTFPGRAGQIAPTLIEGALGIAFSIWLIALTWEFRARSAAKVTSPTFPAPIQSEGWKQGRWILLLAPVSIGIAAFAPHILQFLWPSYPVGVSKFARMAFDLLILLAIFFNPSKKKTAVQPTETSGVSNSEP